MGRRDGGVLQVNEEDERNFFLHCIGNGDAVAAAAAAQALLGSGGGGGEAATAELVFNDMQRKVKRLCSLCERKFNPASLHNRVTKKRIVEWRRARGVLMKNVSPYTLYDYVPVCLFCAQFFNRKTAASRPVKEAAAAAAAEERRAIASVFPAAQPSAVHAAPEVSGGQESTAQRTSAVGPMIFADEDRCAPSLPSSYFAAHFSALNADP